MLELEAEAERQSLLYARRARFYSSLYYIFGLPAAILAAIAGATALASTTGRITAGIIALTSSALSAAVVFLDSGKQRDRSAQTRTYWDDLYNKMVEQIKRDAGTVAAKRGLQIVLVNFEAAPGGIELTGDVEKDIESLHE